MKINKKKRIKCKRSKKAISEIISYVLLIAIALGISVGVYAWMSTRIPMVSESCPEDVSLYVKSYNCSNSGCSSGSCLNLIIKNNGNFNVDGFFIRTSNNISTIPATGLEYTNFNYDDSSNFKETGRFYFKMEDNGYGESLKPGNESVLVFDHPSIIKKIQIEPFVESTNSLQICTDAMINIEVDPSKGCG